MADEKQADKKEKWSNEAVAHVNGNVHAAFVFIFSLGIPRNWADGMLA